jgi:uracil-DNA glycosylase family 4
MSVDFDPACQRCDRLASFLKDVKQQHPDYFCQPVPAFGDTDPALLIVGLAPGMHGANATGRPFTGDAAGILLYEMLYKHGFSNQPISTSVDDDLQLIHSRITNAVKCLPPQNKPVGAEVNNCRDFLVEEIKVISKPLLLLALGSIAHKSIIAAMNLKQKDYVFAHAALHELGEGVTLIDSYHCSRYNTQTGRLTPEMFDHVFAIARQWVDERYPRV